MIVVLIVLMVPPSNAILAGLNHLFQTAKICSPGEYTEIETFAPAALDEVSGWILKRFI